MVICILVLWMACTLSAVDDDSMQELYNTLWYECIPRLHGICLGALLVTLHQLDFTVIHLLISTTCCQTSALGLHKAVLSCVFVHVQTSIGKH